MSFQHNQNLRLEGLSLSRCIADIIQGRVQPVQVAKISSSIVAQDRDAFAGLAESYRTRYWGGEQRAVDLALEFYDSGKIEQPRLLGQEVPKVGQTHWRRAPNNIPAV
jgi:hypothetical protein